MNEIQKRDKSELNTIYGICYSANDLISEGSKVDDTTAFLSGTILVYCQTHTPEEVAELFNDTFNILTTDKACSIASCITRKMDVIKENRILKALNKI